MCFLCLCGLGASHGLASKERFRVAYVWMTSSGDGHQVRGLQVQDEKPEVICFEACGPHHDKCACEDGLKLRPPSLQYEETFRVSSPSDCGQEKDSNLRQASKSSPSSS